MPDPEISIVIVSWNVRDLLIACLRSLVHYVKTPHEVILVDNHSADGTIEAVHRDFPLVRIVTNEYNAGFSRGNNQGWQKAHGQYVCFLNPDTEFINDPFPPLISYFREHPHTGAIGPQLLNTDRTHQLSVRRYPSFADQALILLKLRWLGRWLPTLQAYQFAPESQSFEPLEVDQIMGACIVMPRTVLADAGSFDEGFWIWFEEVDLCRRLKTKGYHVIYDPQAQLIHHGGRSFAQHISVMKQLWYMKSLNRYASKWWRPVPRYGILAIMPLSYLLTFVQSLFKPK